MKQWWLSFLHWKGWAIFARGCCRLWKAVARWKGWGKLFALPMPVLVMLVPLCGAGLVWVFVRGLENTVPACFLYTLSAYTLTALCVRLPGAIRCTRDWLRRHPKLAALLKNQEFKFRMELYIEQFINFAYGIFKIASGLVLGSAWIGCDGIYNMAQALIQLFQILRRRKPGTLKQQWKSYRFCGVLILFMHLTLIGIVFQMLNWHRVEESGEIMIIATAAFAFYKLISALVDLARDRKHTHPIDSSVRMLELSQAIFAIFSLQASMFHVYGTGEGWENLMNILTGCTVCLLTVAMGVYMILRANRDMKKLEENDYGK